MSAFERSLSRIISMSPAYRTHPLAQAIEEAARIFGPEVTAAALLAAVEAASVRSTTPSRSFRRKPWTTLAVIAFAALAGAVVFGGGRESRDDAALLSAPANAAPSSAAPASAVEPAIAGAAPAAPEPERVIEADVAPPSSQRAWTRPRPHSQPPSPPVNPPPRSGSGERHRASVPPAMTGATPRVASASLTPTLPKRQRLRRRLRSLRLRMPRLQQRTRIVRSSSQTMSLCPITTNFVAFDEQQEVACLIRSFSYSPPYCFSYRCKNFR